MKKKLVAGIKLLYFIGFAMGSMIFLTGCFGDKHISQKEAQVIADALTEDNATFLEMEDNSSRSQICYVFEDENGKIFRIKSNLAKPQIDGSTMDWMPEKNSIKTDYCEVVTQANADQICEILERNGFADALARDIEDCVILDVVAGTPEENKEILKRAAAVGVEIDSLLDMEFKQEYLRDNYTGMSYFTKTEVLVRFFEADEVGKPDDFIETASFSCTVSADARWTKESLYENMKAQFTKLEIAE